jgi:glycosyltransferase involved in cell wall biosynthesis
MSLPGRKPEARSVLFFRDFRRFHGGHLKVWDYFNHTLAAPGFEPRIAFAERTRWTPDNPWLGAREHVAEDWRAVDPAAFFVAGRDWRMLDDHPRAKQAPVINLIQGLRHADPAGNRFEFLGRRAIRICVSDEVRRALEGTGAVEGPMLVVPNGVDLDEIASAPAAPGIDLLIVAIKQPVLGRALEGRLRRDGRSIEVLTERVERPDFLERLRQASVTVFLPLEEEGFYLPALEGLAAGTLVVCPDCVGNRSFCLPGENSFRPEYNEDALAEAAEAALAAPAEGRAKLLAGARETADSHSLAAEREAFLGILGELDHLW